MQFPVELRHLKISDSLKFQKKPNLSEPLHIANCSAHPRIFIILTGSFSCFY